MFDFEYAVSKPPFGYYSGAELNEIENLLDLCFNNVKMPIVYVASNGYHTDYEGLMKIGASQGIKNRIRSMAYSLNYGYCNQVEFIFSCHISRKQCPWENNNRLERAFQGYFSCKGLETKRVKSREVFDIGLEDIWDAYDYLRKYFSFDMIYERNSD